MKKVLSIVLLVSLMLSVFTLSVYAIRPEKISTELREKLEKMTEEDTIEVRITLNYTYDLNAEYKELDRLTDEITLKEYGFTQERIKTIEQVDLWRSTRVRLMHERNHQRYLDLYKSLEIDNSEIIGDWDPDDIYSHMSYHLVLTKAKAYALTDHEEIQYIESYSHWTEELTEPPTYEPTDVTDVDNENKSTFLFKEKIEEIYADWLNQPPDYKQLEAYDEPYYHYDNDGEIDWALIRYRVGKPLGPLSVSVVFGHVTISIGDIENNLLGMSVYDVSKDELIPITNGSLYQVTPFDYTDYDGFEEALLWLAKNWKDSGGTIQIYQQDPHDEQLTILDATNIQRYLVGLAKLSDIRIADYDEDGEISILDATAIQRFLAGLE